MYAVTGSGGRTGRAEEVTPMGPELHLPAERLGPDTGEYYAWLQIANLYTALPQCFSLSTTYH